MLVKPVIRDKPILSLDFDGVIHQHDQPWQGATVIPDGVVKGFWKWAKHVSGHFALVVYSSRSNLAGGIDAMRDFIEKSRPDDCQDVEFHYATCKPPAHVTIDDRAITFNGDWSDMRYHPLALMGFKPWNKV